MTEINGHSIVPAAAYFRPGVNTGPREPIVLQVSIKCTKQHIEVVVKPVR